jgi:hypothetical protein
VFAIGIVLKEYFLFIAKKNFNYIMSETTITEKEKIDFLAMKRKYSLRTIPIANTEDIQNNTMRL